MAASCNPSRFTVLDFLLPLGCMVIHDGSIILVCASHYCFIIKVCITVTKYLLFFSSFFFFLMALELCLLSKARLSHSGSVLLRSLCFKLLSSKIILSSRRSGPHYSAR